MEFSVVLLMRPPPMSLAPAETASSVQAETRSASRGRMSGPTSVSGKRGSPTLEEPPAIPMGRWIATGALAEALNSRPEEWYRLPEPSAAASGILVQSLRAATGCEFDLVRKRPDHGNGLRCQRRRDCACGQSKKQPFCDGSHKATDIVPVAWTAEKAGKSFFCGCKHSKTEPLCDGSHAKL